MKVNRNINAVLGAVLLFGACVFTACSKDDDEEVLGVDTTNRVDKYKEMESLVESQPFSQLKGVSVGNAQDNDSKTSVTVFFFPKASMASAVVLGGGPASREVPLLDPQRNTQPLNALVFSGGSAYGLAASDGVATCLEENGHGYNTGFGLVPIVCQSCIFDLSYGSGDVRPDREMGYLACQNAISGNAPLSGNVGAGTGATVGKPGGVADLQKVANIASTGMARCIRPVFTMADGDTVYAISLSGDGVQSDVNTIGVLASLVMEKAIADAILSSKIPDEEYLGNI